MLKVCAAGPAAMALLIASGYAPQISAAELPELDCVVEPHTISDVSSQVDGVVESISVERGEFVKKGQTLAQLDSRVQTATIAYAQRRAAATAEVSSNVASAEFSERRHQRFETLYADNVLSLDQVDEAGTQARLAVHDVSRARENKDLAELDLARAQTNLAQRTIINPIDGVVVERYLAPGESVEEKPILRIAQIDPLRVEVIVPVIHMKDVEVGQTATVYPEAPFQEAHKATVTIVDRVADAASGTFRVRLTLPNPELKIPAGLRCNIRFDRRGGGIGVVAQHKEPR
jgi:RND family efflux transporter MFP subunit